MNLRKENWNKKDYQEFIEYLRNIKEDDYKLFHQKLTPTKYEILGIRVPMQRKIAKEILKGNYESFLNICSDTYYEEVNIKGFILAGIKELKILEKYYDEFLLQIDNWAICDGFCNSLKIVNKHKDYFIKKIEVGLVSNYEFIVRVSLVLLLTFYIEEDNLEYIFKFLDNLNREEYYINMAVSWLLAEIYTKYPKKTKAYLLKNNLSKFTFNKTISKICDSYRVTKEEKETLKQLRR